MKIDNMINMGLLSSRNDDMLILDLFGLGIGVILIVILTCVVKDRLAEKKRLKKLEEDEKRGK